MRGFRGSRAAQNINSRSGRSYQKKAEHERLLRLVETPPSHLIQKLPDWMKTPETLAQEKASRPKLSLVPNPKPAAQPKQPKKRPAAKRTAPKKPAAKRKAS